LEAVAILGEAFDLPEECRLLIRDAPSLDVDELEERMADLITDDRDFYNFTVAGAVAGAAAQICAYDMRDLFRAFARPAMARMGLEQTQRVLARALTAIADEITPPTS
jgi:hypothetical protein